MRLAGKNDFLPPLLIGSHPTGSYDPSPPMVTGALAVLPHLLPAPPFPSSSLPPALNSSPNIFPPRRILRLWSPRAGEGGRSWGSNDEDARSGRPSFRGEGEDSPGKKEKRKWWSEKTNGGFDDEFDMFDDEPEQLWDRIWIFKVFKSYGYLLPAIIASMLLATGPKAFLMALALPLGQSAISLAFDKLWGKSGERPSPKNRPRKKPTNRYSRDFVMWEEDETGESKRTEQRGKYWAAASDNGTARKGERLVGGYGGWDDLDGSRGFRRSPSPREPPDVSTGTQALKKERLTRRGRSKEPPLLVRLLIAIFPFLASYSKLL